jgi:hypothetical protein
MSDPGSPNVISFSLLWQIPETILKEEEFILVHSFRGFSLYSLAPLILGLWWHRTTQQWKHVTKATHLTADRKERGREEERQTDSVRMESGTRNNLHRYIRSDPLPPARPHLWDFPPPPKIPPPARDQALNTWVCVMVIQTITTHLLIKRRPDSQRRRIYDISVRG